MFAIFNTINISATLNENADVNEEELNSDSFSKIEASAQEEQTTIATSEDVKSLAVELSYVTFNDQDESEVASDKINEVVTDHQLEANEDAVETLESVDIIATTESEISQTSFDTVVEAVEIETSMKDEINVDFSTEQETKDISGSITLQIHENTSETELEVLKNNQLESVNLETSSHEVETEHMSIEIGTEEKADSDLDIALSESDASQTQEDIQLDLESDKSEVDFVVDTTEDSEFAQTSEVKLSITQETEDSEISMEIKEENVENVEELSVEGKKIFEFV